MVGSGEERKGEGERGRELAAAEGRERGEARVLEERRGGAVAWWRELGDGTVVRERKTTRTVVVLGFNGLGPKERGGKRRWARIAPSLFRTFQDFPNLKNWKKRERKDRKRKEGKNRRGRICKTNIFFC